MISALILAAGTSSRLGRPKQLLDLGGKPILQHVIDAAATAKVDETVVVLGHEAEEIGARLRLPEGCRVVLNPDYAEGQSTSLRAGLSCLGRDVDAAVILLGDQPDMTAALIDVMVRAWNETKPLAARAYFGGVPGHPVVVSRSLWKEVASQSGDRGAAGLMDSLGAGVVEVHVGKQPLQDVDTWEQYEELRHGD